MYNDRIKMLEETHRLLDKQITEMANDPNHDPMKLIDLKKKKLQYRDDISSMKRQQFEYETQTVNYGED